MTQASEHEQLPWHERHWQFGALAGLRAGTRAAGLIQHGSYADGTPLESPLHVLIGTEAGPVLYIQAAVHGNEVNGIEVIRRVVTGIDPKQMHGVLLAVPVANGPGLLEHQRRNPFDEEDMNRIWPGKEGGMTSQRMAYHLYNQAIRHAQYVIDLHTANCNTLLHVVYGRDDATSRKLAEVFGLEVLLEEEVSKELEQARFTGKLRNVLTAQAIRSAFCSEQHKNDDDLDILTNTAKNRYIYLHRVFLAMAHCLLHWRFVSVPFFVPKKDKAV